MDDETLIINDTYEVKGIVVFEVRSKLIPDENSVTGVRQDIEIEGKLSCNQYYNTIKSIQSKRYCLSGVFVNTEGFSSDTTMIDYIFTADSMHVKSLDEI